MLSWLPAFLSLWKGPNVYRFYPPHIWLMPHRYFQWLNHQFLNKTFGVVPHCIRFESPTYPSMMEIEARCEERNTPTLIVLNHVSFADPYVICEMLLREPTAFYWMAGIEPFEKPWAITAWHMACNGAFSIERGTLDREALETAQACLSGAKKPLVVFPEGEASYGTHRIRPAYDGAAMFALKAHRDLEKQKKRKGPALPVTDVSAQGQDEAASALEVSPSEASGFSAVLDSAMSEVVDAGERVHIIPMGLTYRFLEESQGRLALQEGMQLLEAQVMSLWNEWAGEGQGVSPGLFLESETAGEGTPSLEALAQRLNRLTLAVLAVKFLQAKQDGFLDYALAAPVGQRIERQAIEILSGPSAPWAPWAEYEGLSLLLAYWILDGLNRTHGGPDAHTMWVGCQREQSSLEKCVAETGAAGALANEADWYRNCLELKNHLRCLISRRLNAPSVAHWEAIDRLLASRQGKDRSDGWERLLGRVCDTLIFGHPQDDETPSHRWDRLRQRWQQVRPWVDAKEAASAHERQHWARDLGYCRNVKLFLLLCQDWNVPMDSAERLDERLMRLEVLIRGKCRYRGPKEVLLSAAEPLDVGTWMEEQGQPKFKVASQALSATLTHRISQLLHSSAGASGVDAEVPNAETR